MTNAQRAVEGELCLIDGFTTLILIQTDNLELIIKSIPNLSTPVSTLRLLRETARKISTTDSYIGKIEINDGKFQYIKNNKVEEDKFKKKLIDSANLLEAHVKKISSNKNLIKTNEQNSENLEKI